MAVASALNRPTIAVGRGAYATAGFRHSSTARTKSYGADATFTSCERHGWGYPRHNRGGTGMYYPSRQRIRSAAAPEAGKRRSPKGQNSNAAGNTRFVRPALTTLLTARLAKPI